MNYPILNGMQYRGPGGDGRALAATMVRAAWASFLTRDGERVDVNDITDLHQLAKDLSHDHAPVPAVAHAVYDHNCAKRVTDAGRYFLGDIIQRLADAPTPEEIERQQLIATLSAKTARAFNGWSPRDVG